MATDLDRAGDPAPLTDRTLCDLLRALDARFGTAAHMPEHHDNLCTAHAA